MSDIFFRNLDSKTLAYTTSTSTTLPGSSDWTQYRLAATTDCYVVTGAGSATATTAGYLIPAGTEVFIEIPSAHTHIAAIQSASPGNLNIAAVG